MGSSEQNGKEGEVESLRKALEAETRRCLDLQNRLDRSGVEFEEFLSRAAHDLRESLRDVASYSQLLAESPAAQPDSDSAAWLKRIQDGAGRMQRLLADVVDFWATDIGAGRSSQTDMETALNHALLAMERQIAERRAIVTHDPLPPVYGDVEILTKVLHHLIRNAVAYGEATPRVHISTRRDGLQWIFSVQDNGPGIEAAFHERIFGPFKRLHGKEHPGAGLGLAYCKKAIGGHGGRIWLESAPGAGSTFYFTLTGAG